MANTPIVYVICDQNCKLEGMTKEQIYAAILQAVNEGTIGNIDAGFITTIKTINGLPLKFFVGEQSAYDELTAEQKSNLFAIITNDTTKDGINKAIEQLQTDLEELLEGLENGDIIVKKAKTLVSDMKKIILLNGHIPKNSIETGFTYVIIACEKTYTDKMSTFVISIPFKDNVTVYSPKSGSGYFLRYSTNGIEFRDPDGNIYYPEIVYVRKI